MDKPLKFTLVEIAPAEDFLQMSPGERLRQIDLMANPCLKLEAFMQTIYLGWNFLKSHHVHTR